jgi:hypothetical protein
MVGICAICIDSLIQRCRAVSEHDAGLKRALDDVAAAIARVEGQQRQDHEAFDVLTARLAAREATAAAKEAEVQQAENRIGTPVIVVDQIIQPHFSPWLVRVSRSTEDIRSGMPLADDWIQGRHFIVFAGDAANAARRVRARFAPSRGYSAGEPRPFIFT